MNANKRWRIGLCVLLLIGGIACGRSEESGSGESVGSVSEESPGTTESGTAKERLKFSSAEDEDEGLSREVVAQIKRLNKGERISGILGMAELEGYYALIPTHTVVARGEVSGQEMTGSGKLTMYVPNLVAGLQEVSMLFYDRAAGQWRVVPAERVNVEGKMVTATLTGSGVVTVIYKR